MVALELNAIKKSLEYNFNNIVIVKVQKDVSNVQIKSGNVCSLPRGKMER